MSFDLNPPYENPIEQAMAELAATVHNMNPDAYQDHGEALFAMLVRGLYIYVDAWIRLGDDTSSLSALMVAAEDLNDPSRAGDPHATFFTVMDQSLEAMRDNIGCELISDYGTEGYYERGGK
jgi:hypothetical protein